MHDNIERFYLTGELNDDNIVQAKENLIYFLESQMRDTGFVPVLDLEAQFTLDYQPDRELFVFELSVYGAEVGEGQSWETAGIMGGKLIMKHTHPSK
jgi:hypothetical protein